MVPKSQELGSAGTNSKFQVESQDSRVYHMTIMAASVERLGSLRVKLEGLYPVVLAAWQLWGVAAYAGAAMDVSKLLEDAESLQPVGDTNAAWCVKRASSLTYIVMCNERLNKSLLQHQDSDPER